MSSLLGIDWGTTSFRAYLLDLKGTIVKAIHSDAGILSVKNNDFITPLHEQLSNLGETLNDLPIIASGMITSKNGWMETPYIECPATIGDIAAELQPLSVENLGTIWFVPGVKQLHPEPDIMRGEETQLAGLEQHGKKTVILPGTHSKWVKMEGNMLTQFKTFMTGDMYNAVLANTILQATPMQDWSDEDFLSGVVMGYERYTQGTTLLSALFQVRVQAILELSSAEGWRSFISGLLIGTEIGEGLNCGYAKSDTFTIIGAEKLAHLYCNALKACNITSVVQSAELAAQGLYRLAQNRKFL